MADTRVRILEEASELFADQGYEKTSLREIADRVGVTKAALYYHFPSKEALLGSLLEPFTVLQDRLLAILDGPVDLTVWAEALTELVDHLIADPKAFQLLNHNLVEIVHDSEHFAEHLELHRRSEQLFADTSIPLEQRVRMACALAVATSVIEVGASTLVTEDPAATRAAIIAAIHAVIRA